MDKLIDFINKEEGISKEELENLLNELNKDNLVADWIINDLNNSSKNPFGFNPIDKKIYIDLTETALRLKLPIYPMDTKGFLNKINTSNLRLRFLKSILHKFNHAAQYEKSQEEDTFEGRLYAACFKFRVDEQEHLYRKYITNYYMMATERAAEIEALMQIDRLSDCKFTDAITKQIERIEDIGYEDGISPLEKFGKLIDGDLLREAPFYHRDRDTMLSKITEEYFHDEKTKLGLPLCNYELLEIKLRRSKKDFPNN